MLLLEACIFLSLLHFGSVKCSASNCAGSDCLKEYIDLPDSHYAWTDTEERIRGLDPLYLIPWTGYVLNFTSQQWGPEGAQVSRSVWWHQLVIIVPDNVNFLYLPILAEVAFLGIIGPNGHVFNFIAVRLGVLTIIFE